VSNTEPSVTDTTTEATHTLEKQAAEVDAEAASARKRRAETGQEHLLEREREVGAPAEQGIAFGGGGRARRVLLIGLGGAVPDLALGAWRSELRTIDLLAERGAWCRLRSGLAWDGAPAWASLFSGLDAGQLGIYAPSYRVNHSYLPPQAITSRTIHASRLWDLLGLAGKHVGVVGVPATTPAAAVRGHLIGDRPLADGMPSTYPSALAQQVNAWLGDAALALPEFSGSDIDGLVRSAYIRAEQRFMLARRLLARDTYDCFVLVDDGIATIQRALWHAFDPTHPRYAAGHPFASAIGAFYRFVDDQLFELLELVDDETLVVIVSPYGTGTLQGELALNEWLIAQGELVLRTVPSAVMRLEECDVDWEHSRAWAGDAGTIYLNVVGREPQGAVPSDQADAARARLADQLRALQTPNGMPALNVYRPETLFAARQGVVPDLLVACAQPGWRTTADVGLGSAWRSARSSAIDAAGDTSEGFLIMYDPHGLGGGRVLDDATLYDFLPTLLNIFDQPIPARFRGRVIAGL
jgi:predicted AlkP superfamily phosphohydrolase/phosphomutase